jgi:hypothetical protein
MAMLYDAPLVASRLRGRPEYSKWVVVKDRHAPLVASRLRGRLAYSKWVVVKDVLTPVRVSTYEPIHLLTVIMVVVSINRVFTKGMSPPRPLGQDLHPFQNFRCLPYVVIWQDIALFNNQYINNVIVTSFLVHVLHAELPTLDLCEKWECE